MVGVVLVSGNSKKILMIGTDPVGKGGIAAVVSVYRDHGLFRRFGVQYVPTHREGSMPSKILCGVVGGITILRMLLGSRVSLVHAQVASYGSFKRKSMYLALARLFGVPTIFHLHGAEFKKFADEIASPGLRLKIVRTLKDSTQVVALSDSWADYIRSIAPGAQVCSIANPVFMPTVSGREMEESGRILFLGRADQRKGVFDLLNAFAQVVLHCPNAKLAVGGDGDLDRVRADIQELGLSKSVEVLGWVSGDAKQAQMARAQVFVLPSYDEGLPMAMLEAMAHGKAIVVTPVGGIPEAVQHGQQGLLVQPGAVDDLAQALVSLVDDAALRARLGDAARARVAERFGTVHVLGRIGALYESLGILPSQAE